MLITLLHSLKMLIVTHYTMGEDLYFHMKRIQTTQLYDLEVYILKIIFLV